MTVRELKEKLPETDVTELKDGVRYILRLPDSARSYDIDRARQVVAEFGLNALVVPHSVELFEIVE
jgi:hypothetical protein